MLWNLIIKKSPLCLFLIYESNAKKEIPNFDCKSNFFELRYISHAGWEKWDIYQKRKKEKKRC